MNSGRQEEQNNPEISGAENIESNNKDQRGKYDEYGKIVASKYLPELLRLAHIPVDEISTAQEPLINEQLLFYRNPDILVLTDNFACQIEFETNYSTYRDLGMDIRMYSYRSMLKVNSLDPRNPPPNLQSVVDYPVTFRGRPLSSIVIYLENSPRNKPFEELRGDTTETKYIAYHLNSADFQRDILERELYFLFAFLPSRNDFYTLIEDYGDDIINLAENKLTDEQKRTIDDIYRGLYGLTSDINNPRFILKLMSELKKELQEIHAEREKKELIEIGREMGREIGKEIGYLQSVWDLLISNIPEIEVIIQNLRVDPEMVQRMKNYIGSNPGSSFEDFTQGLQSNDKES